jgi:hypothetical protein
VSDPTVTIEILSSSGLNFDQAPCFRPDREARPVNPSTLFRWIMSSARFTDVTRRRSLAIVLPPDQERSLN